MHAGSGAGAHRLAEPRSLSIRAASSKPATGLAAQRTTQNAHCDLWECQFFLIQHCENIYQTIKNIQETHVGVVVGLSRHRVGWRQNKVKLYPTPCSCQELLMTDIPLRLAGSGNLPTHGPRGPCQPGIFFLSLTRLKQSPNASQTCAARPSRSFRTAFAVYALKKHPGAVLAQGKASLLEMPTDL